MYDVEIVRGTTNNFEVIVFDEAGARYTPLPGDRLLMGVKKNKNDQDLLFVKAATVEADASAHFTIKPEDTADLCCAKYFYDVGMESGTDFYPVIPASEFRITPNITSKGCANG